MIFATAKTPKSLEASFEVAKAHRKTLEEFLRAQCQGSCLALTSNHDAAGCVHLAAGHDVAGGTWASEQLDLTMKAARKCPQRPCLCAATGHCPSEGRNLDYYSPTSTSLEQQLADMGDCHAPTSRLQQPRRGQGRSFSRQHCRIPRIGETNA